MRIVIIIHYLQIQLNKDLSAAKVKTEMPYLHLLPVALLCFAFSYDYIKDATDLDNQAIQMQRDGLDATSISNRSLRKYFIGCFSGFTGLVVSIISLQKFEVKTNGERISVSYNF